MGEKPSLKGNLVQKDPMQNIDVKIVKFDTF